MIKKNYYWLLAILLSLPQVLFTLNSLNQIRYEELAESVRNVYWLQQHRIYDSISSNVGWYGTLLVIYNLFGFHLFAAKFLRLGLHFLSLLSMAAILTRYLGKKYAWLPLIIFSFSPTLIYFNTLQTSYGIDLQYFPITLYLISSLNPEKKISFFSRQFLLWSIAMIAWMSYPPFIFYLPVLGTLYYLKIKNKKLKVKSILLGIMAFLLPLLLAVYYLNPSDRLPLFRDRKTQAGIFRGNGNFSLDPSSFWQSLTITLSDLFSQANSYYFELAKVEFSDFYPILTVLFVLIASLILLKKNIKLRLPILLSWLVLITTITFSHLSGTSRLAGLRRSTPMLAAFYALYAICWLIIVKLKHWDYRVKRVLIGTLLLLPLHHLLVYSSNLRRLKALSPYREQQWFTTAESPDKSLTLLRQQVTTDNLKLVCKDQTGQPISCRYDEVFAAVASDCLWNRLPCKQILAYDVKEKKMISLSIENLHQRKNSAFDSKQIDMTPVD